ncbi:MAG: mucoidy inhibitor MuiA family protein [Thioalkalivibrio sp.]|nr:MAG: mucoidy inhibitor MuiA family protein [Thioalkalivibrio sp.]
MTLSFRMSKAAVLLLFGAALLPMTAALAEGISEVTVYPDRATVTRVHTVEITRGDDVARIHPLPPRLDPASLRVRAEGLEGLRLRHAETRIIHGRELAHPEEQRLTEALQSAQDGHRRLVDRRQAEEIKLGFIRHLVENAGAVEPGLPPDDWHRAWGMLGDGALEALERITLIDGDMREIDEEIQRIRRELDTLRTDRRDTLEAAVHYSAPDAGTARLILEYEVPGATWSPLYEARLDTVAGRMEWVQQAEVRQNTGEAWEDVMLRLSTARPALGGRLPELQPWFIDAGPGPEPTPRREMSAHDALAAPAPAAVETAALEATGFTSQYRVPGRVSLPPDNRLQHFLLARDENEADLSARAVPQLSPHAFLFAETVFEGEAPLLPGSVNLFQDGQLVGRTRVGTVAPGAPLNLAFGVDDRIGVERMLDRDSTGRQGLLRRQQRLERSYRITVDNHHDRALPVTVLDRLPVSRDERIKVELTPETTEPAERDVDGRLGVLAWELEPAAGAKEEVRFGFTVSWPEDLEDIQGLGPGWR